MKRANQSFSFVRAGTPVVVNVGDLVDDDHVAVIARPTFFDATGGDEPAVACDHDGCEFVAKTPAGLASHSRTH